MTTKRIRAKLEATRGGGAACKLDFDPKAIFGRARAPVRVTINGYTFRTTLATMGGCTWLGINKQHRRGAGIDVGDSFRAELSLDEEPRAVKAPPDLLRALKAASLVEAWEALGYTHRREHVEAVEEAKKPETRARRIERALAMMRGR